ncbi:unnamed protein product [Arctogadus glacialis]
MYFPPGSLKTAVTALALTSGESGNPTLSGTSPTPPPWLGNLLPVPSPWLSVEGPRLFVEGPSTVLSMSCLARAASVFLTRILHHVPQRPLRRTAEKRTLWAHVISAGPGVETGHSSHMSHLSAPRPWDLEFSWRGSGLTGVGSTRAERLRDGGLSEWWFSRPHGATADRVVLQASRGHTGPGGSPGLTGPHRTRWFSRPHGATPDRVVLQASRGHTGPGGSPGLTGPHRTSSLARLKALTIAASIRAKFAAVNTITSHQVPVLQTLWIVDNCPSVECQQTPPVMRTDCTSAAFTQGGEDKVLHGPKQRSKFILTHDRTIEIP